ncbi:MAG: sugar ABC transporter permease [Actinomycetia bacterium]|nr:sugar ABC transporter permease [Actinomycetes bacterium]MCL2731328.1 sugar ABC transporter permease [Actinomycetes bacterium]
MTSLAPPRGTAASADSPAPARRRADRTPYVLIAPSLVVLLGVLAYPLVKVVILSTQKWGVAQIFSASASPTFVGFDNYTKLLGDPTFWTVLVRTVVLTVAMVGLSMGLGFGIALLMRQVPAWCRRGMTFALVLAWSVPTFISTEIFRWITEYNSGVANWALGMQPHNWYTDATQGLAVATAVVVWGAVPLIAITLYAGLMQIPAELVEAARMDGAGTWGVFRHITLPVLRSLLAMLTTLSVIWDFQVFNQIWILRNGAPSSDYYTLGIYAYVKAYAGHDYGLASATAVLTVVALLGVMVVYLRQIAKIGELS